MIGFFLGSASDWLRNRQRLDIRLVKTGCLFAMKDANHRWVVSPSDDTRAVLLIGVQLLACNRSFIDDALVRSNLLFPATISSVRVGRVVIPWRRESHIRKEAMSHDGNAFTGLNVRAHHVEALYLWFAFPRDTHYELRGWLNDTTIRYMLELEPIRGRHRTYRFPFQDTNLPAGATITLAEVSLVERAATKANSESLDDPKVDV